jgi:hypothetical protein
MKHKEIIAHAANHPDGWASLEAIVWSDSSMIMATQTFNPVTHTEQEWRIKPAMLKINVEIPKPCSPTQSKAILWFGKPAGFQAVYFKSAEDRDEAERILVAALRSEK